jgi:AcrR family transcriptional regulator
MTGEKRRGRKPYRPTQPARELVMTLVAASMTLPEIASVLDISRPTLCAHFPAELATGRAKRLAEVIEQLRRHAKGGSVAAARSLLAVYGKPAAQPLGKKQAQELAARTAGAGTAWDDLLHGATWKLAVKSGAR